MLYYKINVLEKLKEKGYNTNKIRKNKILSEGTLQKIRENAYISMSTLDDICNLLKMDISEIIGWREDIKKDAQ